MRVKDILNRKDYYTRLAQVESSGNPNAKSSSSSASGMYQFIDSTWIGLVDEMGLDYTLKDRFDPEKSKKVLDYFTNQNANYLKKKLGREPNEAELYIAHFAGMGTAGKLANLTPDSSINQMLSEGQINSNKGVFEKNNIKNVKQFYDWAAEKFNVPEERRLFKTQEEKNLTNLRAENNFGIFVESTQDNLDPNNYQDRQSLSRGKIKEENSQEEVENPWKAKLKEKIQKRNNLLNLISSEGFDLQFVEQDRKTMADMQPTSNQNVMRDGGQIKVSSDGLYAHPRQPVLVPTQDGRITMKNISYPVKGISQETGEEILMQPGGEYQFKNTQNVLELPQLQKGGSFVLQPASPRNIGPVEPPTEDEESFMPNPPSPNMGPKLPPIGNKESFIMNPPISSEGPVEPPVNNRVEEAPTLKENP